MRTLLISTLFLKAVFNLTVPNCTKFNSLEICEVCPDGSYLFEDNICRFTSPKPGCLIYGASENKVVCVQCNDDYYLQGSTCKLSIPNCVNQNSSVCLSCNPGYKLAGNECISPNQNPLPAHCTQLDTFRMCSTCKSGYRLSKSVCVLDKPVCNLTQIFRECLFKSNGQCTACNTNYVLQAGRCKQIKIPNCLYVNNSQCVRCDLFYSQAGGGCVNDNAKNILGCLRTELTRCVECSPGYTLNTSTCIKSLRPIQVRRVSSIVVYVEVLWRRQTSWYSYCSNNQNGVCKACQKHYILSQNNQCVRDISEMKKFSQISISSNSFNNSNTCQLNKNPINRNTSGSEIWLQLKSNSTVAIWGVRLTRDSVSIPFASQVFVVYKNQGGFWVCHSGCKLKTLSWSSNSTFQWVFAESVRAKSVRVYLTSRTGNGSLQVQFFYEDPLFIQTDLVSVWSISSLYKSAEADPTFGYKLNQSSVEGGLTLRISANIFVGYNLSSTGVVRIRKVVLSAGGSTSYVTSFILKYSLDGTNFYCVDSCSLYLGLASSTEFVSISIRKQVYARYMIVVPVSWAIAPSIRLDFYYDSNVLLAGCSLYDTYGRCQVCQFNYSLTNGVCKANPEQISGCKKADTVRGRCMLCEDGYYLSDSGKCPQKAPGCVYTGSTCSSCVEAYSFKTGTCSLQNSTLRRMSDIGVKLYSSQSSTSKPLFTDDCNGKGGWCAGKSDNQQWAIMTSSQSLKIYKIVITPGSVSWLQSFSLYFSNDLRTWIQYTSPLTLLANSGSSRGTVQIYLTPFISAKSIKMVPLKWGTAGINFNFEAYYYYYKSRGEYYDRNGLYFKSFNDVADVFFSQKVTITEMNTRIGDNGCFTLPSTDKQYIQLSLDEFENKVANITSMYIRGSNLRTAWVKTLSLMYSTAYATNFKCYKNCSPIQTGLVGPDDLKIFALDGLINITDIRVMPLSWSNANSMRVQFAMS